MTEVRDTEGVAKEAGRRYPRWLHEDLHHAGYWAFLAGAKWQSEQARPVLTREQIARTLGEFVTHIPVRNLDGPNGDYWLREADALLAQGDVSAACASSSNGQATVDAEWLRTEIQTALNAQPFVAPDFSATAKGVARALLASGILRDAAEVWDEGCRAGIEGMSDPLRIAAGLPEPSGNPYRGGNR